MRVVLTIRTSKSCVVAHFRVADTPVFGLIQRIDSMDIVFQEGYIAVIFFDETESADIEDDDVE